MTAAPRAIIVLGMHRGGTSVVTRGIQALGATLGDDLLAANELNPTGYFEHRRIVARNEQVLRVLGMRWWSVAPIAEEAFAQERMRKGVIEAAAELRQLFGQERLFCFKDPRTARLLPFWLAVFRELPFDVSYVIAVRHPEIVARSLATAHEQDFGHAQLSWLQHMLSAMRYTADKKRVVVDYDRLVADPGGEMGRVGALLGLERTEKSAAALRDYASGFVTPALRRSGEAAIDAGNDAAPAQLAERVYRALLGFATSADGRGDVSDLKAAEAVTHGLSDVFASYQDALEKGGRAQRRRAGVSDAKASGSGEQRSILIVGHSHVSALKHGWAATRPKPRDLRLQFLQLFLPQMRTAAVIPTASTIDRQSLGAALQKRRGDRVLTVLIVQGNEHNAVAFQSELVDRGAAAENLRREIREAHDDWLSVLEPQLTGPVAILLPPPPVGDGAWLREHPGLFAKANTKPFIGAGVDDVPYRVWLWHVQCETLAALARERGYEVLAAPAEAIGPDGLLRPELRGNDPTHANGEYGKIVNAAILQCAREKIAAPSQGQPRHPYEKIPPSSFWKAAISDRSLADIDPVGYPTVVVSKADAIATAGSCFAQHVTRRLLDNGFKLLEAERGALGDGFSARFGNIYTARQLLQLYDRAHGHFSPAESVWARNDGRFVDAFRPRVAPEGHASVEEVERSRAAHLAAVATLFETLDVFVFTLGLTEAFFNRDDGAVYPVAPGVVAGQYDPARHGFVNFSVAEVVSDMTAFLTKLRAKNGKARVILTVSPVALVATFEARHVLVANTQSKAVLRVACEQLANAHPFVDYFPSYELIANGGDAYLDADRRTVSALGVDRVMSVFMRRVTRERPLLVERGDLDPKRRMQILCDEEALAQGNSSLED